MKFTKIDLNSILLELKELQSDWMDARATHLMGRIPGFIEDFRRLAREPSQADLEQSFRSQSDFLDICRLFLGKGQESVAHIICDRLGGERMTWSRLRRYAAQEPSAMAAVMVELGLPALIQQEISRDWKIEDVLLERYKLLRGRAVAGQSRGRALEESVQQVLDELRVPYEVRVTFIGQDGKEAKCDFAIPSRNHPKIVIESKGFEATGSKLTDFLGDILKIIQAREYQMYFFVVTDGRGWFNRRSDLRHVVDHHQQGKIDMVYTTARLPQLAVDIKRIYELEM